ncbi:hypothetical protein HNR77_001421 [Paenibacillus sp. JGP012]|uniref:hypothetical protein n=1 Tax=Paenibacillus sp. JGP012 TaxID=2735914 RepID=UPI001622B2BD|nr:hypothetical protein [Paenibacillus sp. JGP012]MBB6020360.1 hypothetical protein [Paenibacillus sp. JGP012]
MINIKRPWKKNFFKTPEDVQIKSKEMQSDIQTVSGVKKVLFSDVQSNLYQHLGITMVDDEIRVVSPILPLQSAGRYSGYNVNGRTIIRRDLPKVNKSYSVEVPNFGDWSKGSHDMSWTRQVFKRTHWLPTEIRIVVDILEKDDKFITFKFSLDRHIDRKHQSYEDDLLFHCNLLQENTGICDIFESNANDSDYTKTLYVNWELLPPGDQNIARNVEYFISKFKDPSTQIIDTVTDRIRFFESLQPLQYIVGESKFSRYIGAMLKDDLVLLENVRYGNAVYIFQENWKDLSQLSRIELLHSQNKNFIRIVHRGNWKNRIFNTIRDLFV